MMWALQATEVPCIYAGGELLHTGGELLLGSGSWTEAQGEGDSIVSGSSLADVETCMLLSL